MFLVFFFFFCKYIARTASEIKAERPSISDKIHVTARYTRDASRIWRISRNLEYSRQGTIYDKIIPKVQDMITEWTYTVVVSPQLFLAHLISRQVEPGSFLSHSFVSEISLPEREI